MRHSRHTVALSYRLWDGHIDTITRCFTTRRGMSVSYSRIVARLSTDKGKMPVVVRAVSEVFDLGKLVAVVKNEEAYISPYLEGD